MHRSDRRRVPAADHAHSSLKPSFRHLPGGSAVATGVLLATLCHAVPAHSTDLPCRPTRQLQGGWIGNAELRVSSFGNGRITFRPGGPGFVTRDGSLGMKFLWERFVSGTLQVTGRRLDGPAAPLRTEISPTYGDSGLLPSYLIFPTPGCWEVTGRVREQPVSMVLWIEKIGAGPDWRRD